MAAAPVDFSSIGGKPVSPPSIDFSSIGGKPVADATAIGNAGNEQKPMVTPLAGESFEDTLKRAIAMGKSVTPEQRKASEAEGVKQIPTVLGTALAAGPAVLTAGALAPAAASEAAGGGILGGAAGGATAGGLTSLLTQPTQGQNPFSGEGLKQAGESAVVGGMMGGMMGAGGKLAGKVLAPFTDAEGTLRIPTTEHAGQGFQDVSAAVGKHTVPMTDDLSNSLMQYRQQVEGGGSRSLSVEKLLSRVTDPEKPPLTFDEARTFQSNISRLSRDEADRLAPVMKMRVGQVASALNDAVSQTANTGGKLQAFQGSMREYAQAKQIEDFMEQSTDVIKKNAVKAVVTGLGTGAGAALASHYLKQAIESGQH
jgi:hypothetical protein